ncbi:MAG: hypothetical protein IKR85_05385 [Clostridia bacterium]|nr:hypothetical protein [Clostridia bacterium]
MFYGTRITYGLDDWQIINSDNGSGRVTVGGLWRLEDGAKKAGVSSADPSYRLVNEFDNSCLTDWIKADHIDSERWETTLTVPRGGLYRLETCLDAVSAKSGEHWRFRGDIRNHIGCGDVFAIAGQSNAAGYGKGVMPDPPDVRVHVRRNSGRWDMASHPLNDATDAQDCLNAPMGQTGTSPFIAFGRRHADLTGAPVGLLPCAQGGSPIRMWDPEQDGALLKNMITKIKDAGGANAVLWYQGCADAAGELARSYAKSFENVVTYTRKALGWEIPFYTFQLNKYYAPHDDGGWDVIRQTQRQMARSLKNVFILPTCDLSLSDEIHLCSASNAALGERLALLMDKGVYAPDIERALKTGEAEVRLEFANVKGELIKADTRDASECFELTDAAGNIPIEAVKTEGSSIVLTLARPVSGFARVSFEKERMRGAGSVKDSLTLLPVLPFLNEEIK